MSIMADVLHWVCILLSGFLGISGVFGLLRFPDLHTRLHANGVTDSLCVAFALLGLMIQAGWSIATVKLILIFLFLLITGPITTHAIAWAAQPEKLKSLLLEQNK